MSFHHNGARPIRACLIQHSTRSDNLGVGALTASEVEILRGVAGSLNRDLEITVMDWKDPRAPYVTGPDIQVRELDGRAMISPRGFLAVARASDVVIDIGGGDSFTEIYGTRRLHRMLLLKALTHLARTPLVMAPQTIGPFTSPFYRALARQAMQRATLVATRDSLSTQAARELGVTREVIEASDVALRLPFDAPPPRLPGGPPRAGINVSGLLMRGGYTGRNEFGISLDYPALIRDMIRLLQARGAEVHLVPHVLAAEEGRTFAEDDYAPSQALASEFPGVVLAPRLRSPSEAKTYIAGLDFFAGARMHACIAAFSSGVPVVPMAYSRKFAGLFGSLGYNRTVDCTREAAPEVLAAVADGFDQRLTLVKEAKEALKVGLAKLGAYEKGLAGLLEKA